MDSINRPKPNKTISNWFDQFASVKGNEPIVFNLSTNTK